MLSVHAQHYCVVQAVTANSSSSLSLNSLNMVQRRAKTRPCRRAKLSPLSTRKHLPHSNLEAEKVSSKSIFVCIACYELQGKGVFQLLICKWFWGRNFCNALSFWVSVLWLIFIVSLIWLCSRCLDLGMYNLCALTCTKQMTINTLSAHSCWTSVAMYSIF